MLYLTRNVGERIIIGDGDVTITVVKARYSGEIKLGFETKDKKLPIHREEIYLKKKVEGSLYDNRGVD